jgi:hypothetical protein
MRPRKDPIAGPLFLPEATAPVAQKPRPGTSPPDQHEKRTSGLGKKVRCI